MASYGGFAFDTMGAVTKKRRTDTLRRARPDFCSFMERRNASFSSSTPSENMSKASSDENASSAISFSRKQLNLNSPSPGLPSFNRTENEMYGRRNKKNDGKVKVSVLCGNGGSTNTSDVRRASEGVLAPAKSKGTGKISSDLHCRNLDSSTGKVNDASGESIARGDISSQENKFRKVKLKVGGITRTIHTKASSDYASEVAAASKMFHVADTLHKKTVQENSDDDPSISDRRNQIRREWKYSNRGIISSRGSQKDQIFEERVLEPVEKLLEPVRKSKRVPKKRVLDGAFDEDEDDDEELRYLGRLKAAKSTAYRSSIVKAEEYDDATDEYVFNQNLRNDQKNLRPDKMSEDVDYMEEEEEVGSDRGLDHSPGKLRKEYLNSLPDGKKENFLTTRQRALQSGKDGSVAPLSQVEFPDGLPPAPSKRQKEKLSDVEQQLKKAEAAQRRRLQVEKANRETEAEAIRKILGQDSNRKRKEDKQRKQREELAREKAANAAMLASNTVRWNIGPTGTTVTFADDVGLPSIFSVKPCSYPPPREKCAGPSCTNPYKYRDSKSRLPLCSLQCYRAVQGMMEAVSSC